MKILGNDHGADNTRVYALSRIKDIQFTEETFDLPKDFDVSKHVDLSFGIWDNQDEPVEYELLFNPGMANYILEQMFEKSKR